MLRRFLLVAVSACVATVFVGYVASIVQHLLGLAPPATAGSAPDQTDANGG